MLVGGALCQKEPSRAYQWPNALWLLSSCALTSLWQGTLRSAQWSVSACLSVVCCPRSTGQAACPLPNPHRDPSRVETRVGSWSSEGASPGGPPFPALQLVGGALC